MIEVKYPGVKVRLTYMDGNAFVIIGMISRAMREAGIARSEIESFKAEATSVDYDQLLQTCKKWVDCS